MTLPRPVSVILRFIIDFTVVTAIVLLVPGIPPDVKFEKYSLAPVLELQGPLTPNKNLDTAELLFGGSFTGPESVAVRGDELYTGLIGGDVVRIKNGKVTPVGRFGKDCAGKYQEAICGRPLGMRFDNKGKLIIADSYYGIHSLDVDSGKSEILVSATTPIDGKTLATTNDLDIAKDGSIYFSDSSRYPLQDTLIEFLGEPSGRLLKYDPATKKTTVLLKGLHFANGVQLSQNEDFVLVSETCHSRVTRYYLKGDKKGQSDIFIDGLPGFPDNIRTDAKGGILVSLIATRTSDFPSGIDILGPLPWVRKLILRITTVLHGTLSFIDSIAPNQFTGTGKYYLNHLEPVAAVLPKRSIIVHLDQHGKVLGSLHNSDGKVHSISQITVDDKRQYAYLGSPYNHGIWRVKVDELKLK